VAPPASAVLRSRFPSGASESNSLCNVPFHANTVLSPCNPLVKIQWTLIIVNAVHGLVQAVCFHIHGVSQSEGKCWSMSIWPFSKWMTFRIPCVYGRLRGISEAYTPSSVHLMFLRYGTLPTSRSRTMAEPAPGCHSRRFPGPLCVGPGSDVAERQGTGLNKVRQSG
jgi:hypothetical protein